LSKILNCDISGSFYVTYYLILLIETPLFYYRTQLFIPCFITNMMYLYPCFVTNKMLI